jgi:hypothetical protein
MEVIKEISNAQNLLKATKPCPWCGIQPNIKTKRVGHRDDPDRIVYLQCRECGVSQKIYVKESESEMAQKLKCPYETAVMAICAERILSVWNERKVK